MTFRSSIQGKINTLPRQNKYSHIGEVSKFLNLKCFITVLIILE